MLSHTKQAHFAKINMKEVFYALYIASITFLLKGPKLGTIELNKLLHVTCKNGGAKVNRVFLD